MILRNHFQLSDHRIGHLSHSPIHQSLSNCTDCIVLVVESEDHFINVSMKILLAHAVVCPYHTSMEYNPQAFNVIGNSSLNWSSLSKSCKDSLCGSMGSLVSSLNMDYL